MRARLLTAAKAVSLTRRGWWFLGTAAVAFVGAYSGGRQELLYVGCLLVALPVTAFIVVWTRRPAIEVVRTFSPELIQAGETATVKLTVRNTARSLSMAARWRDGVPWYPFATPESSLPRLQPRGPRFAGRGNTVAIGYNVRPPHRGVFAIGPLRIESSDAFGLVRGVSVVGESRTITVTPEVVPLVETGLSVAAGDGDARVMQRRATGNDDDITTREYRSGDAMRRVHWRASARHGDLMVRQEEQSSFPEARIIVDTLLSSYRDLSDDEADAAAESAAFEWVVRMLASVAVHLRRGGFLVTIDETGPDQLASLGRGRTWGDEQLLTSLASFSLTDTVRSQRVGALGALAAVADKSAGHPGTGQPGASQPGAKNSAGGHAGPVIALIGHPDSANLDWLEAQRRPGQLAVVFMVRGVSAIDQLDPFLGVSAQSALVLEHLQDAGWLVVPVRADDDHAAAWSAVAIELGRSRGSA